MVLVVIICIFLSWWYFISVRDRASRASCRASAAALIDACLVSLADALPRVVQTVPVLKPPLPLSWDRLVCACGSLLSRGALISFLQQVDPDDVEIRRSKFHFVDLAGSERAKRTGASGQRFKEVRVRSFSFFLVCGEACFQIRTWGSKDGGTKLTWVGLRDWRYLFLVAVHSS